MSTFGFSEFASPEAALRCVRLLNSRAVADKQLLAKTDGKMQALVDTYKSKYTRHAHPHLSCYCKEMSNISVCRDVAEQRSRLGQEEGAPGTEGEGYLDARQRALDEAAERRLAQIMRDYQDDINNYELLQKGTLPIPTSSVWLPARIRDRL